VTVEKLCASGTEHRRAPRGEEEKSDREKRSKLQQTRAKGLFEPAKRGREISGEYTEERRKGLLKKRIRKGLLHTRKHG